MYYHKTLRWLEPFGGWGDHSNFYLYEENNFNGDTGLCNRILHWEIASYINKQNYNQYTILVQEMYWPELEILHLPETSAVKFNRYEFGLFFPKKFNDLKFLTVYDVENMNIEKAKSLNRIMLEKMFYNKKFQLKASHIYSDFGYDDLTRLNNLVDNPNLVDHLPKLQIKDRPLKNIKIKFSFIDNLIYEFSKNCVGIHIRRHNGVYIKKSDIKTVPESVRKDYVELIKKTNSKHNMYKYIRDDVYFKIIDEILKINPKQKFYISCDLPKKYVEHFIKKYGENILSNEYLIKAINEFLINSNIDVVKLRKHGNVVNTLVDLFVLSYSKFLIKSDKSTWSEFAQVYKDVPAINATEDIQKITELYIKSDVKLI